MLLKNVWGNLSPQTINKLQGARNCIAMIGGIEMKTRLDGERSTVKAASCVRGEGNGSPTEKVGSRTLPYTVAEALKSARFVVDPQKKQKAVLLDIQSWETLIHWVEDMIDTKISLDALAELKDNEGNPEKAGWLNWEDVREEW